MAVCHAKVGLPLRHGPRSSMARLDFSSSSKKIGTPSVHVGSRKKDQLTKLVICEITLTALFFPFKFSPPTNLTFREF